MKDIEIKRIKPGIMSFIMSIFFLFIGIIFFLFIVTMTLRDEPIINYGIIIVSALFYLISLPLAGGILGLLFSFVYNFIAKRFSGIRMTIEEKNNVE